MCELNALSSGIIRIAYGWTAYTKQRSSGMLVGLFDNKPLTVVCKLEINCYCKTNASGFDDSIVNCYECSYKEELNNAIQNGIDKTGALLEIRLQDIPIEISQLSISLHRISNVNASDRFRGKIQQAYARILDDSDHEIGELIKLHVPIDCDEIKLGYIRRSGEGWVLSAE